MRRRRGGAPGARPAIYLPQGGGGAIGAEGQMVLSHLPLDHVFDARNDMARLFGAPDFLWVDGDGNSPTIGPTLSATGSPSSGEATPWAKRDGTAVTAEEYDGSSYRRETTEAVDPDSDDDIVIAALIRTPASVASFDTILSTYAGARGWLLFQSPAGLYSLTLYGDSSAGSSLAVAFGAWALLVGVVDRDSTFTLYANGTPDPTPGTTPAGALGSASGISIGARTDTLFPSIGRLAWASVWYGDGIAELWTQSSNRRIQELTQRALGIWPKTGGRVHGPVTFTRATARSLKDSNSVWHLLSSGMPAAGDSLGLLREGDACTNKCHRNANPGDTAEWTASGGVKSLQTPSMGDAEAWGPNVVRLANSSGSDQYMRCDGTVGNTNAHSLFVLADIVAGSGARLGLYDGSTWTDGAAIVDSWGDTEAENITPANVNQQLAIKVPDGCTVDVAAQHMEEASALSYHAPVPNWATDAGATANAETLTHGPSGAYSVTDEGRVTDEMELRS